MRGMFASRRGSHSAPVLKHGKFVLSFYSIFINVCMERLMWGNQWHNCTLNSGEGHSSRGGTFCSLYAAVMFPRRLNILYVRPRWFGLAALRVMSLSESTVVWVGSCNCSYIHNRVSYYIKKCPTSEVSDNRIVNNFIQLKLRHIKFTLKCPSSSLSCAVVVQRCSCSYYSNIHIL
jgi:hypothetical protein